MNNPLSPHDIPPRTSSAGAFATDRKPSNAVLRPLSEGPWLSSGSRAVSPLNPITESLMRQVQNMSQGVPHPTTADNKRLEGRNGSLINGDGEYAAAPKTSAWSDEKEKILQGPYDYMFGHPGKDIRAQLIAAFNAWLHVPESSLQIITKVVGMLHTASLLVDDVEDSSVLRRGVPVAHSIFGTAQTINSANYVYFCALRELQRLRSPKAIEIYTDELLNLHRGQGMDLFWRDTLTCPSEDDYLEMVGNKTGGLFRLAVKLMQAESSSTKDCVPLVSLIGLLFQILDDYKNLSSAAYAANKGLCEDLTEGKFSFPIIHAVRADPSNLVIINILRQKTTDDEVKRYAVSYMERVGSFAHTRKVLEELTARALAEVDRLEEGEGGADGGVSRAGDGIREILQRMRVEPPQQAMSGAADT